VNSLCFFARLSARRYVPNREGDDHIVFVVHVHACVCVCVIGMAGAKKTETGWRRRLKKEQRRRVLEPLSFLRAVQLLQRVLRLSHSVSTLSIPCSYLLLFVLLLLLLLRLSLLPLLASAFSHSLARAQVTRFWRDRILRLMTLSTRRLSDWINLSDWSKLAHVKWTFEWFRLLL